QWQQGGYGRRRYGSSAGRGHQRRLGHAGRSGNCRSMQRRAAARRDRLLHRQASAAGRRMNGDEFDVLSSLVRKQSGLVLTRDKAYLLESRLLPVARKWRLKSLTELATALHGPAESGMIRDVVEAMTTNESFFFRDVKPF